MWEESRSIFKVNMRLAFHTEKEAMPDPFPKHLYDDPCSLAVENIPIICESGVIVHTFSFH